MPPQEGRRSDGEGDPAVARDQAAGRREEDAIPDPEPRRTARPLEDPELMAQDEDLEVLGSVSSAALATGDDETRENAEDEV